MKEIKLTKGHVTLVDDEDFEYLNQFRWFANIQKDGRIAVVKNRSDLEPIHIKMHRLILGISDPKIKVDHRDRNPLNNQRNNIRSCNLAQNNCNATSAKNSTSKYLGVSFHKGEVKRKTRTGLKVYNSPAWRATIFKDYKQINIGRFKTEQEAALAYNEKAKELHGEFANLNKI